MALTSGCRRCGWSAALLLSSASPFVLGCTPEESVSVAPAASQRLEVSFLTPRYLSEAIDKLVGLLPKPSRILNLTALNRVVIVQAQDAKDPTSVIELRYGEDRTVSGPTAVELRGPGKLSDNLFRVDSIDLHVAEKVLERVRSEYAEEVRKLVITRNLPASMDIQFRVFLQTSEGDRTIAADKKGRLLGPLTPSPTPTNSPGTSEPSP